MPQSLIADTNDLPIAVRDLAMRLGAPHSNANALVYLEQSGLMKRTIGASSWMKFNADQEIAPQRCAFKWRARFGPLGIVSVCDGLDAGRAHLDVSALGIIPLARTKPSSALLRGELMRYLAEMAWAPDALWSNGSLRWRTEGPDILVVGAGQGKGAVEVTLTLNSDGRVASAFAPDRPRSDMGSFVSTPWRGQFWDYRLHAGRWLPFSAQVAWVIDGAESVYWQARIERWEFREVADALTDPRRQ
jgi:hypothetical protein